MAKRIREKAAKRNAERDRRPQATAKYIRISATKVRVVLNLIRGQSYPEAVAILKYTPKGSSETILKVLESAGANAENNLNMSKDDLYVAECFANEGQTLKRLWYRSRGSADMLQKRSCHITIVLDEKVQPEVVAAPKAKTAKAKTEETKTEKAKTAPKAKTEKVTQPELVAEKAKTEETKTEKAKTAPKAKTEKATQSEPVAEKVEEGTEKAVEPENNQGGEN